MMYLCLLSELEQITLLLHLNLKSPPPGGLFVCVSDLDFTFLEMNPFTLVNGKPYPLDMRGELDDTAAFKNFKK